MPCKLSVDPANFACPYSATAGDTITLKIRDETGAVKFESASYNGANVPIDANGQITITVAAGHNKLFVIYRFSDPVNGSGTLLEVCDQELASISVNRPAVAYMICA